MQKSDLRIQGPRRKRGIVQFYEIKKMVYEIMNNGDNQI